MLYKTLTLQFLIVYIVCNCFYFYRTKRCLNDTEVEWLLNEDPDFLVSNFECDDFEEEDEEEEVITQSDHDSTSEQECASDAIESDVESVSSDTYYIGRDKTCKWKKSCSTAATKTKSKNIVKILPGPKAIARDVKDDISAFTKIITIDMIDEVVKCTNMYIQHKKTSVNYVKETDAKETTRDEIMALFGLLYILGTKKANHTNVSELWTTDGSGMQILRAVMSSKRFLFLLRCLRFDDKRTRQARQETDKLAAIRTILDEFIGNCKNSYSVSEFVTVDEKLQAFRGRCNFIQYIPNKPAKYGIKMFALCDAKTFYTSNLEIYCGKQPQGPYAVSNSPSDVVSRLTSHIEGSNRNVTMDNWYTSYALAISLLTRKLTCIGTMRKNKREIPPEFLPKKDRVPNSSLFGYQKNITMVSYVPKKNKAVILLSTMHDTGAISEETNKPEIIMDYNATKGGVDTVDQMCASYSVARITRRWPLAIFFALMDIAGINAQIIYHANSQHPKIPRRIFLKGLSYTLMKPHLLQRAKIPSLPSDVSAFLRNYKEAEVAKVGECSSKKRGRCVNCGRAKNINTTIKCDFCHNFVCKRHVTITYTCENCKHVDSE